MQLKYFQIHYLLLRRILQVLPLSMMAGQKGQSIFFGLYASFMNDGKKKLRLLSVEPMMAEAIEAAEENHAASRR